MDQLRASASTRSRLSKQSQRDTRPEILLRRELHSRGLRFRLHARPVASLRRTADVLFPRSKVAVFVDGCFWHGCGLHGTLPKNNRQWWAAKLARNADRDRETDRLLSENDWLAIRVWEHEDIGVAAGRVARAVRRRWNDAPSRDLNREL